MRPEIAKSQASTLREWADEIDKTLLTDEREGFREAAFLYRRAAKAIEAASAGAALSINEPTEMESITDPVDQVRSDSGDA